MGLCLELDGRRALSRGTASAAGYRGVPVRGRSARFGGRARLSGAPTYPQYPTYPQDDSICATRPRLSPSLCGQERPRPETDGKAPGHRPKQKAAEARKSGSGGSGRRGHPRKKREATAARPMPLPLSKERSSGTPGFGSGAANERRNGVAILRQVLAGDPPGQQCLGRATREGENVAHKATLRFLSAWKGCLRLGVAARSMESGGWRQR